MSGCRRILHVALFLVPLVVVLALVSRLAGYPELGSLKEKLLYFERQKDGYEVIFVGSSRVKRGVIPHLFDRELSALGVPARSFNFGIAGMKTHEANALIRRVLAMEPGRLRWIVVELGDWDPVIRRENRFKRRGIFWHDASETRSALRSTFLLEDSVVARADLLSTHGLHFAARLMAVGRGPDAMRSLFRGDERTARDATIAEWQGFKPFTESSYKYNPLRKRFLKNLDEYREALAGVRAAAATGSSFPPYNVAAVRDQVAMIRAAGVEPVHLIPPTPRATPELDRLEAEGHVSTLLAFNRPEVYPDLFDIDRRFDREHLDQEGAQSFTRLLASLLLAKVVRNGSETERIAALRRGSGGG